MVPPRPHPLAVSATARLANGLVAAIWKSGLQPQPRLEPDYLWAIGSKGFTRHDECAGRGQDEVADFRLRLERLCESLRTEARLNPLGLTLAYGQLTAAIRKRHALGRLWHRRPGLAATTITPPIIVVGQMRSGTTRIHRLLAADPAHAGTRFCDSVDPVPRSPDGRPIKAAVGLTIARRINPWLDTLHPFGATRVDEEIGWLSAALSPCAYEAQWHIPGFVAWSEVRDPAPVYREFDRILRTDAAVCGNAGRARVLKCPQFSEDLGALTALYPAAGVVIAERDRKAVLDSAVSLVASQSSFQSDDRSTAQIRAEWTRKLALREQRLAQSLAVHSGPCAAVTFDQLNSNWRASVSHAYRELGLTLTPAALVAMEREQRGATQSPHASHAAALSRFARSPES